MSTLYIIERKGEPVAMADAVGLTDALQLYIESLGVSARVAGTHDVLMHRALPVLARGAEPAGAAGTTKARRLPVKYRNPATGEAWAGPPMMRRLDQTVMSRSAANISRADSTPD